MSEKTEHADQMVADTLALIADGALTIEDVIRNRANAGYLLERAYETMAANTAEIARLRATLAEIKTKALESRLDRDETDAWSAAITIANIADGALFDTAES